MTLMNLPSERKRRFLPEGAGPFIRLRLIEALGAGLTLLGVAFFLALATFDRGDPSFNLATPQQPHNLFGMTGAYTADFLLQSIGLSAWLLAFIVTIWGLRLTRRHAINAERETLSVTKGDTVRVMRGEDKGKEGKVIRVLTKKGRIVIEGVNIVKKHRKARNANEQSAIIDMPAPLHVSNVMLLDPKSGAPTRTRRRIDTDGTKERISVKSGDAIPRNR